jgi:chaperonin GroEL
MAKNCGLSPDIIVKTVRDLENNYGINFMTGDTQDLVEAGIIDPAKVTRCALQNAVSVASTIITTSHAIVS